MVRFWSHVDYDKILELDPSLTSYRVKRADLTKRIDERNEKLKQEMLGKLKDVGNKILGKFGMSVDNFKMVKDPATGGYSIRFEKWTVCVSMGMQSNEAPITAIKAITIIPTNAITIIPTNATTIIPTNATTITTHTHTHFCFGESGIGFTGISRSSMIFVPLVRSDTSSTISEPKSSRCFSWRIAASSVYVAPPISTTSATFFRMPGSRCGCATVCVISRTGAFRIFAIST